MAEFISPKVPAIMQVVERADSGYPIRVVIILGESNMCVLWRSCGRMTKIYEKAEVAFKSFPETAAALKTSDVCEIQFFAYNSDMSIHKESDVPWLQ